MKPFTAVLSNFPFTISRMNRKPASQLIQQVLVAMQTISSSPVNDGVYDLGVASSKELHPPILALNPNQLAILGALHRACSSFAGFVRKTGLSFVSGQR
jgi:hypothetical protein